MHNDDDVPELEEGELLSDSGSGIPLEDREALQKAMRRSMEIFTAPAEAGEEEALDAVETLEEIQPYFSETEIFDSFGEVIELLHEAIDCRIFSFEDAQRGKLILRRLERILGFDSSRSDDLSND